MYFISSTTLCVRYHACMTSVVCMIVVHVHSVTVTVLRRCLWVSYYATVMSIVCTLVVNICCLRVTLTVLWICCNPAMMMSIVYMLVMFDIHRVVVPVL